MQNNIAAKFISYCFGILLVGACMSMYYIKQTNILIPKTTQTILLCSGGKQMSSSHNTAYNCIIHNTQTIAGS
jgi:preprotein translocase subunit SecD